MSLTKFTGNTNVVSQLADVPVQTGDELKAKFDEAGTSIKNYLNNTLTTEVEQLVATEKTALQNSISSLSTSTTSSINELRTAENAMISDGYSTTKSYKIGDLCIYNNVLYRCTTAIDEGEAWNSSHWEQTNLGDEVRKSEVYSTEEKVVGTWIDGEPIYRKVYYLTYSSQRIDDNINIGFDNWDKVITLRGLVLSNNDHSMFPIPGIRYYHGTLGGLQLSIVNKDSDWRPNTIYIYGETFEIDRCVIIFEYTKTTD